MWREANVDWIFVVCFLLFFLRLKHASILGAMCKTVMGSVFCFCFLFLFFLFCIFGLGRWGRNFRAFTLGSQARILWICIHFLWMTVFLCIEKLTRTYKYEKRDLFFFCSFFSWSFSFFFLLLLLLFVGVVVVVVGVSCCLRIVLVVR